MILILKLIYYTTFSYSFKHIINCLLHLLYNYTLPIKNYLVRLDKIKRRMAAIF